MSCRRKGCSTCWIHRNLLIVAALSLATYWTIPDAAARETSVFFAFGAVFFLLVVRHAE